MAGHTRQQFIDGPAALDELRGQPFQQPPVGGGRAVHAEIVRRADDPPTKMMLPKTVDHHAGREWVLRIGAPVGKFPAATANRIVR